MNRIFLLFLLLFPTALRAGERWVIDPEARVVLGQVDFETAAVGGGNAGLNRPSDVAVDPATGKVFVVDTANHRVLRFPSFAALFNGRAAEAVLGQSDFATVTPGTAPGKMSAPYAATVDAGGRLWVADGGNHRVLKFNAAATRSSGGNADGVLGQPGFATGNSSTSRAGMNTPCGVAVDSTGVLFVVDSLSNRILIFADAATLADFDGADATGLLGQPNFNDGTPRTSRQGFVLPRGIAIDSMDNLYVADSQNNRVLRYDLAREKGQGAEADFLIGQVDFDTVVPGPPPPSANGFFFPFDLSVDPDGRLWIADLHHNRVLGFSGAAMLPILASADLVLGQMDFSSDDPGLSSRRIKHAGVTSFVASLGVATDAAGRVYVADSGNHRVVVFTRDSNRPDARIGLTAPASRGNGIYNASGAGQTQSRVHRSRGKAKWFARFENDGNISDSFRIRSRGTTARFRISVFLRTGGRRNVTVAARLGTHISPVAGPRGLVDYDHEILPQRRFRDRRSAFSAWIQGSSTTDGTLDRAISRIVYRPR